MALKVLAILSLMSLIWGQSGQVFAEAPNETANEIGKIDTFRNCVILNCAFFFLLFLSNFYEQ